MAETITIVQDGHIAKLFLNRPQVYNAFDYEMVAHFAHCLANLAMDSTISGIVNFRTRQSLLRRWRSEVGPSFF